MPAGGRSLGAETVSLKGPGGTSGKEKRPSLAEVVALARRGLGFGEGVV